MYGPDWLFMGPEFILFRRRERREMFRVCGTEKQDKKGMGLQLGLGGIGGLTVFSGSKTKVFLQLEYRLEYGGSALKKIIIIFRFFLSKLTNALYNVI